MNGNRTIAALALSGLMVVGTAWGQAAQPRTGERVRNGDGQAQAQARANDPTRQGPIWHAVNKASLGASMSGSRTGYGGGLSLTTPYRYNNRLAFRAGVERQFLRVVPKDSKEERRAYTAFRVGAVAFAGMVADHVHLYAEGGLLVLQPDLDLAAEATGGVYGQLGVEFFPRMPNPADQYSVFFDFGLRGANEAKATKLEGKPNYANGFHIRAGARYYY